MNSLKKEKSYMEGLKFKIAYKGKKISFPLGLPVQYPHDFYLY